jgi:hypothetical protein
MISKEHIEVLRFVVNKLKYKNINWCLVGTTNLIIQGVKIESGDIDIITDEKGVYLLSKIFKEFEVKPPNYSSSGKFRSFFSSYQIKNIKVEVMGNFQYKTSKGIWSKVMVPKNLKYKMIRFDDFGVNIVPLNVAYKFYKDVDREATAQKIKKYLKV